MDVLACGRWACQTSPGIASHFLAFVCSVHFSKQKVCFTSPSWVIRDKLEGNVGKPFVCMCTYTYMYISGYFCDASMVWHSNCVCVHVYSSSSSPLGVLAVPHVLLSKHISTTPDYAIKGQPPLSILKLRFSNLNLCRSPAPASPISMLTQDVFFLWPFLASTLKFGVRGRDGLMAYKSVWV